MNILITGQNGFIGKALFALLQQQGHNVLGTVRNKQQAGGNKDIVAVGDIGPETDWNIPLKDIEIVIHLANRAHVLNDNVADPLEIFRSIVD